MAYGPVFLTPEEQRARLKVKLDEYYALLAHSVLEGRDSWEFHRKKMDEYGLKLDRLRLTRAVIAKGVGAFCALPNGPSASCSGEERG